VVGVGTEPPAASEAAASSAVVHSSGRRSSVRHSASSGRSASIAAASASAASIGPAAAAGAGVTSNSAAPVGANAGCRSSSFSRRRAIWRRREKRGSGNGGRWCVHNTNRVYVKRWRDIHAQFCLKFLENKHGKQIADTRTEMSVVLIVMCHSIAN
jgi:hypothetical protein